MKQGSPLCLGFPSPPLRTLCEIYNPRGEMVARGRFNTEVNQCLDTVAVAPGLYYAVLEVEFADGTKKNVVQKVVVIKP